MTTLNAKANNAYNELIAAVEQDPDYVWAGFDHERDAYEAGWEAGYKAAQSVVDREAAARAIDPDAFDEDKPRSPRTAAVIPWAARRHVAYQAADAVLALLTKGTS